MEAGESCTANQTFQIFAMHLGIHFRFSKSENLLSPQYSYDTAKFPSCPGSVSILSMTL